MRRGKLVGAAHVAHQADLRIEFDRLFGTRLHPGVGLNVLRRVVPAFQVPPVVVVRRANRS